MTQSGLDYLKIFGKYCRQRVARRRDRDQKKGMLSYTRLKKSSERCFQSVTGITKIAFEKLLPEFRNAYTDKIRLEISKQTQRKRNPGGGAKPALSTHEDQLLYVLFFFKHYPTQDLLGVFYGNSQPWANKWVHRLTSILQKGLGYKLELPERPACTMEELFKRCPELKFILDSTERTVQRPKDEMVQKKKYSGKKKRHTVKNTILTNQQNKKVIYLGPTTEGTKHDKKMADDEKIPFPEGSRVLEDLGYIGYSQVGVIHIQPTKKPRGGELTPSQKDRNREISRERIGVEHSIGGVKIFRVVHDVYRNHKNKFDDLIMEVACGLYNLRVGCRLVA